MAKPFADIQTDAEYLRAVGMGPIEALNGWVAPLERCIEFKWQQITKSDMESVCEWGGPPLGIHDTDPARKWDNLANVLRVLGPEMDRRGWLMWRKDHKNYSDVTLFDKHGAMPGNGCAALPHLALLEAFYNAHAHGETA
jgi:hypothetical protein